MFSLQQLSQIKKQYNWVFFPNSENTLLAIGDKGINTLSDLNSSPGFKFGCISYDLKNKIERLQSIQNKNLHWNDIGFFKADFVKQGNTTTGNLNDFLTENTVQFSQNKLNIQCRVSKQKYIETVEKLKQHIQFGDIYEINYCIEFFADNAEINPFVVFEKLNTISEAPFAVMAKFGDKYVLCSSPERYIKKQNQKLISQPIKGTRKRSSNETEDNRLKNELKNDAKEQRENVMIVDLVRNDLSKIALKNSVNVDELFGVYSFKQVHQLISTVSCELDSKTTLEEIIKASFPMGSMTGAPKVRAMQLIDEYEELNRGLYSGSIGFIDENNNFDFNVVIRTIIYDTKTKYLSFSVGSAITAYCDAEKEWEECMLKANAMFKALE